MAKAIKLRNELYLDTRGIVHKGKILADILYPVGSVYISVNDVNPATLYGGTWQKVSGYYLLAWYENYGTMGGKWFTNDTELTIDQIPSHNHDFRAVRDLQGTDSTGRLPKANNGQGSNYGWGDYVSKDSGDCAINHTGGGQGHNHYFETPWFKVNVWYRTA